MICIELADDDYWTLYASYVQMLWFFFITCRINYTNDKCRWMNGKTRTHAYEQRHFCLFFSYSELLKVTGNWKLMFNNSYDGIRLDRCFQVIVLFLPFYFLSAFFFSSVYLTVKTNSLSIHHSQFSIFSIPAFSQI